MFNFKGWFHNDICIPAYLISIRLISWLSSLKYNIPYLKLISCFGFHRNLPLNSSISMWVKLKIHYKGSYWHQLMQQFWLINWLYRLGLRNDFFLGKYWLVFYDFIQGHRENGLIIIPFFIWYELLFLRDNKSKLLNLYIIMDHMVQNFLLNEMVRLYI